MGYTEIPKPSVPSYSGLTKPSVPSYGTIDKPGNERDRRINDLSDLSSTINGLSAISSTINGLSGSVTIYSAIIKPTF